MANASKQDILALEIAHKGQLVSLLTANHIFIGLLPKIKGLKATDKKYVALTNYGKTIAKLVGAWAKRQIQYEAIGIPKMPLAFYRSFLKPADEKTLIAEAKAYIDPDRKNLPMKIGNNVNEGTVSVGIIPLLIWGVIALVGAFTVKQVLDHSGATASEKVELLQQTEKTLKELNITGSEAAAILQSTQAQASEGSGGLLGGLGLGKGVIFGGLALLALLAYNKSKTNK